MEDEAKRLWELYSSDADWEPYDHPDSYTAECNISLAVDGYSFSGWGTICCGEKEIAELFCTTPNGTEIKIV